VHSVKSISPEILDVSFDLYSFEWTMPTVGITGPGIFECQ
jgi:hypothetical protein